MFLSLSMAVALAAQSPQPAPASAATPEEEAATNKMICRKDNLIGSRVKKRRTCMTQREWEKAAQGGQDDTQRLIDESMRAAPPPG